MVHLRLNENESNPNPYVNFITALPAVDLRDQERARQLLRALAAQVKPIMKAHGFAVNSLEEYEYNVVFAGRNWNNGETVELVLRCRDGSFVSTPWLIGTLCHELAHIKHMNHGPDFQALWSQLRKEVIALQARGYYGDGMWSSGTRLADSANMAGNGPAEDDYPEYMCGGAQSRARPSARRRRQQSVAGPSTSTGAQTAKRRKAGSRVTAAGTFIGSGQALNADKVDKIIGTGFRKKAGSKRARDERAMAAEKRLPTLRNEGEIVFLGTATTVSVSNPVKTAPTTPTQVLEIDESDADMHELRETDQDRHRTMMNSMDAFEANQLKTGSLSDFWGNFILPECSTGEVGRAASTATKGDRPPRVTPRSAGVVSIGTSTNTRRPVGPELSRFGLGSPAQEEIRQGDHTASHSDRTSGTTLSNSTQTLTARNAPLMQREIEQNSKWSCLVCTLDNDPGHLACSACATPRGDTRWQNPIQ
ncbi:WLM domain-containing protein [Multifurca ochricompacta]|uniref:WLM domain-containing protein n=1 Tax=Multifurca ochricompacta TaxID=376703 RepID=A0AAD4M7B7_9AGAM|nr:WLM domain-containing protein [Multifurca ochricompacta]